MGWGGFSGTKPTPEKVKRIAAWNKERLQKEAEDEAQFEKYAQRRSQLLSLAYTRGQNECLALCAAIHVALPREIRDMIYDHLIPPRRQHHVFEALDEQGKPRTSLNPLVSVSFFDPRSRMPAQVSVRSDVWKYREYTGPVVVREIAERWYHTGLFVLDAEDCLVEKFLGTDVWEHDALPAEAVRHMKINFRLVGGDRSAMTTTRRENLRMLERIGNRATEIIFQLNCNGRYRLVQLLRMVRPVVMRLRGLGFEKVSVCQGCVNDVPRDLTRVLYGEEEVGADQLTEVENLVRDQMKYASVE